MDVRTLRDEVFKIKQNYGRVAGEWHDRTWLQYYAQDFKGLTTPSDAILSVIEKETARVLGEHVGKIARESIQQKQWVSTADHHGLLCHPYFYGSNLAQSHQSVRCGEAHVVLPFGTVSLGNDSFPRGFFFHDQNGIEVRYFFQSLKYRRMPVCALPPFSKESFIHESLRVSGSALTSRARERLATFMSAVVNDECVWTQLSYSAQLTALNAVFWKLLFGNDRGTCVYLDIEAVVRRLLLERHLVSGTHINNVLFDATLRSAFIRSFDGVVGAHGGGSGTHFFWYVDKVRNERDQLFVNGNTLQTMNGGVSFELTPSVIAQGLEDGVLVPSTALMLLIINAEEGLACAGGASQGDYLSDMITRWEVLTRGSEAIARRGNTTIIGGDYAYFDISGGGNVSLASLFDVYLYSDDPARTIDNALETVSVGETVDALLPLVYRYTTHKYPDVSNLEAPAHIYTF